HSSGKTGTASTVHTTSVGSMISGEPITRCVHDHRGRKIIAAQNGTVTQNARSNNSDITRPPPRLAAGGPVSPMRATVASCRPTFQVNLRSSGMIGGRRRGRDGFHAGCPRWLRWLSPLSRLLVLTAD